MYMYILLTHTSLTSRAQSNQRMCKVTRTLLRMFTSECQTPNWSPSPTQSCRVRWERW